MKFSMKRVAALVLALVMVIGLLPIVNNSVDAVDISGLTDGTIGLSYATLYQPNGNVSSWTASGNAVNGILQGLNRGPVYMKAETTLTITNNKSSEANLSFDYAVTTQNGSTVTIDGTAATGGSFEKKLKSGESIKIVMFCPQTSGNKNNKATIAISNLVLASASNDPVTTTFEAPAYGSYTVSYGSESLTMAAGTVSKTATNLPSVTYTMTANPGQGYKLVGWYNVTTDTYLGTDLTYTGSFEEANTVKAVIVPENVAVFMVSNQDKEKTNANYYADLNEAVAHAQASGKSQITLVQSGILPAGNYTVPAGVTLLIPMDTDYSPTRTDDPDFVVAPEYAIEQTAPYAFLTLTMADGAKLTVNGTLDVESKHTTLQGNKTAGGRPCGAYGAIYMNPEASITLNNGSNLFAWGYIYGDGNVVANSGAKVYEIMQVTDFPGGSNMSQFVDTDPTFDTDGDGIPSNDYIKTFPFSQYYVQNIEVALTLNEGAAEYVYITMTAGGQSMGLPVRFIGEGGMFIPGEGGNIVKDYDPSTDRLNVTVNGDATMAGIALDLTGTQYEGAVSAVLQGVSKVDSASFVLTLNSNITINIVSGTTTVKQDLSLLPGVEITVDEGATLIVAERSYGPNESDNLTVYQSGGYNIYVWDMENWGEYVFKNKYLSALTYSPTTGRYTRKYSDLKDVKIDINGTVLSEGFIYSTVMIDEETWMPISGGAEIISTGKTGQVILQNGAGIEDMAYCLDGSSSCDGLMFVDSLWLKNGDGSFVLTDGADFGTTYHYCDVHDLWYTEGHGNCVVINTVEITWIVEGVGAPEEYLLGETPSYKGGIPTKPANGCTAYTFIGWAARPYGEVLAELPVVSGEAAYFAVFAESEAHVGDNDENHFCDGCGDGPSDCVDADEDHICDFGGCGEGLTDCEDADKDHYCDYAGCGSKLSNCEDNDEDHYCDFSGCGDKLSNCVDHTMDHYCDYDGCHAKLSSCADGNNDHYCDYNGCRDMMSSCKDANNDHRCDYVGCHKILSSCVDTDDDHYCDFAGCHKQLTYCDDNDEDHYCDFAGCGEELTECEDSDEDHYCDYVGCEYQMTDCVDTDGDHYCDFSGCGEKIGGCVDVNLDHICDSEGCGNKVSQCADRDHNHYCDYTGCNAKLSNCKDDNQDHKCDFSGCMATLSTCVDSNNDHYCDYTGCKDKLSNCKDNNKDHYCDFSGCGDKLSSCKDGNSDHNCDYSGCNKKLSDCVDADDNHYCDFGGCNERVSDCVDADEDHYCDFGACGEELSSCADANEDHYCDFAGCGAELSSCVDANEDHNCDFAGCGAGLTLCVDSDEDHYCDFAGCREKISSCYDKNNDHYCDYAKCGEKLTNCKDDNQNHKCDFGGCNAVLSTCVDANMDHKCDFAGCQAILSNCEDADEDHRCDYSGCKAIMSTCVDADEDHYCDYAKCGKQLTDCYDDDDHYCDYAGCGAKLSDCIPGEEWEDVLTEPGCEDGEKIIITYCDICGEVYSEEYKPIPALGHGHSEGWEYMQIDNDVHQVWCADCWSYTYNDGHDYVNHVCEECGWTERMSIQFYNGTELWKKTMTSYGDTLGIAGMEVPAAPTGYQFAGWYTEDGDKVVHGMTITENIVAYATWSKNIYTVTWIVNGVTTVEPYEYGATPSFKGSTDKAADGCTSYTFTGWDKELVTVTGNMTYIAQYEQVEDHVGFPLLESNKDGKTHNMCCSACLEVVYANVNHSADEDTGRCGCGVIQVSISGDDCIFSDAFVPSDRGFCVYVEPDTDFSANLTYIAGSRYTMIVLSENPMIKAGTNKLTITKEEAAEIADNGYRVMLNACWCAEIRLNGGAITEQYKAMLDAFGYSYGEDALDMIVPVFGNLDLVSIAPAFVREGYILIGFQDKEGNVYSLAEEELYFETDKDTYLVAIWQCDHNWDDATCTAPKTCSACGDTEGEALGHGHTQGWAYVAGTREHEVICKDCCGYSYTEAHSYVDGVCVCEAVGSYTLTVYALDGSVLLSTNVPYGVNVYNYVKDLVGGSVPVNVENQIGELVFTGWMDINTNPIVDGYTMPAEDLEVVSNFAFTGWIKYGYIDGWVYESLDQIQKTGWTEIDGSWYYLDTETGIRAEGLTRVPYPTVSINGITYAPNAEDVAYEGDSFIDKDTALFVFDENGKFQSEFTGKIGTSYAVNGCIVWNVGLVEIDGDYYYFKGDKVNGGNIMVTGDYYISRNNTEKDVVIGGLYTFGADGKLCWNNGITEVNGVLRYYENARLMLGNGLTQVGENFIYVNSNGELIVDAEYYIGANELGIKKGIYTFDANGFIVIPEEEPGKEGLHFEDGKWFYYVDGAKAYCAGLIQIDGNWVYVKSDGSLATGTYYITNTNGHETIASGTKCTFDNNGVLIDPVIGVQVLEEGSIRDDYNVRTEVALKANGKLTIDVSNISMVDDEYDLGFDVDIYSADGSWYNEIVRGEGVVEFDLPAGEHVVYIYIAWFDGADDDEPRYGRGSLDYKITFTADGTPLNGIVDGYYYVDGHIAYAAGLIEIDGYYYYVRSNGQIVTDCQYWITNVNDTGVEPGLYEFGYDGYMYEIYVETFTGIKDGYFYIDDEVAYAAGLLQYNGGYIYVRSNGQVATGKYWITNHNDLLPEGFYDFGEDGYYYPAVPENAHLLMEVDKNVDTDGFWDSNAIANAVRASADGNLYIEVTDVTFENELDGQGGFCIEFEGSYWVMQWDAVYKVGTGTVMIPVSAGEDVILFVNPADVCEDYVDSVYGTISYKVWSDVECELVQGGVGE